MFTQDELMSIQARAEAGILPDQNPYWNRLYANLSDAARHVWLQQGIVCIRIPEAEAKEPWQS
jgi:hypothetical protein